jgi:hypothetical protein
MKHFAKRWNDWCGDADMEKSIRNHLTQNGYFGQTAKLTNVRLVAVQRPGWLQVFRFEATARLRPPSEDAGAELGRDHVGDSYPEPEAEYHDLLGLVKDDIRHKVNTIRVFDQEQERRELFRRWTEDLICLRGAQGLR